MPDEKRLRPKVSIIGAGNVGVRYAFALALKGLARSMVIVDLDKKRAHGEAMDLLSCMPYIPPVQIVPGEYKDLEGSDLVVITAGRNQKPGQTRLQLAGENVAMFRDMVPEIMKYSPDSIWLVASNPVDVLTYAAHKISGKSWRHVIGSGCVLDSARLRFILSERCEIDARNIHAYILGEHGQSEFAAWSRALVGGTPFEDYCPFCGRCGDYSGARETIFREVRDFAEEIIEKKGETSYGIALAMVRITEAILNDENSVLPVSCYISNYYHVKDVCLSVPAVINRSGLRELIRIRLSEQEMESLHNSAGILKGILKETGF